MAYEIDHLFICTSAGAPEADRLVEFGLTEGSGNRHPGQGTANRRFFFRNAMLELLWIADSDEAHSDAAQRTKLFERWTGRNAGCAPFGVCLRPSSPGDAPPPFSAWEYRPAYLPRDWTIHVRDGSPLTEPMWFFASFGQRSDRVAASLREPIEHLIGFRELTAVRVFMPRSERLSPIAREVIETGVLSAVPGDDHLLELTFDGGRGGHQEDFRPVLPLRFRW